MSRHHNTLDDYEASCVSSVVGSIGPCRPHSDLTSPRQGSALTTDRTGVSSNMIDSLQKKAREASASRAFGIVRRGCCYVSWSASVNATRPPSARGPVRASIQQQHRANSRMLMWRDFYRNMATASRKAEDHCCFGSSRCARGQSRLYLDTQYVLEGKTEGQRHDKEGDQPIDRPSEHVKFE